MFGGIADPFMPPLRVLSDLGVKVLGWLASVAKSAFLKSRERFARLE